MGRQTLVRGVTLAAGKERILAAMFRLLSGWDSAVRRWSFPFDKSYCIISP